MSRKLVLFDVDGTLITRTKVHREAFSAGFKEVFGIDDADIDKGDHSGKTDKSIVIDVLRQKGVGEKDIRTGMSRMFFFMGKYVEDNIREDNSFHEIPHANELLAELEKKGCVLGLVTGNVEKIAKLKLKKLGLLGFFKVGAFGDSSEDRSELVLKAIKAAEEKFRRKIARSDIFVIGDTPRDVEGGKEAGVRTIAVATGPLTLSELKKCKPDYAFADFSEWENIARAIHSD